MSTCTKADVDRGLRLGLRFLCWGLLILVPLFWAVRGLDMTDTGFMLTNQRLIFSHPENVTYWFHLWLANIVGGLVDLAFGGLGVLAHKIAAAFIFWATAACVFALYRSSVRRDSILVAIVVSMTFGFMGKINIVHYDNLSALLYVAGAALLLRAVLSRSHLLFALSGFVLGLNVFARLPNLVGLGLIFVPFFLNAISRDPERRMELHAKDICFFFAGAVAAASIALLTMVALGHLKYYAASLLDLGNTSAIDAGSYNKGKLVRRPLFDTLYALLYGLPLAAGIVAISAVLSLFKHRWLRVASGILLSVVTCCFAFTFIMNHGGTRLLFRVTSGLCYWTTLAIVLDRRSDIKLRLAAVLAACLSLSLNIGSDTGIGVSSYVFFAMFPCLFAAPNAFVGCMRGMVKSNSNAYHPLAAFPLVVVSIFLGVSVHATRWMVYRDTPDIGHTVNYPQLRGVFTSAARASALEEDLPAISRYAPPGSVLFAYDSLPLLHFAAKTRPYLGNPWPVQFSERYLDTLLRQEESRGPLPVVVLAKKNARNGLWPNTDAEPRFLKPVQSFLRRNHYKLAWESSSIEIYTPSGL
jgi:hypothetical protein